MSDPLVSVTSLRKYYGRIKAVDGISFSIRQGESFGLVGESGCGKTTTGRCLLGLTKPTAGGMEFDGQDIFGKDRDIRVRRGMQIIFQDPYASLDPRMTASRIVQEGILAHGLAKGGAVAEMASEYLDLCGIPESQWNRYPREFSGGQRQRIGIARALALKPRFIVADEPVSALDVSIRAQILNLMSDLKVCFGLTFLFISHDLEIVRYFCDRIGVMYLGTLVETGTAEEIFVSPCHPYTQALVSAIPAGKPGSVRKRLLLSGDIPSLTDLPSGCRFHTRCPYACEVCVRERPELKTVAGGREVSCHRVEAPGRLNVPRKDLEELKCLIHA